MSLWRRKHKDGIKYVQCNAIANANASIRYKVHVNVCLFLSLWVCLVGVRNNKWIKWTRNLEWPPTHSTPSIARQYCCLCYQYNLCTITYAYCIFTLNLRLMNAINGQCETRPKAKAGGWNSVVAELPFWLLRYAQSSKFLWSHLTHLPLFQRVTQPNIYGQHNHR